MKLFTKETLILANNFALKLGYNRALDAEKLQTMPEDSLWAVTFTMMHEHKAGQPTDPHVRCMLHKIVAAGENEWRIDSASTPIFIDVIPEVFELLPDTETEKESAPVDAPV